MNLRTVARAWLAWCSVWLTSGSSLSNLDPAASFTIFVKDVGLNSVKQQLSVKKTSPTDLNLLQGQNMQINNLINWKQYINSNKLPYMLTYNCLVKYKKVIFVVLPTLSYSNAVPGDFFAVFVFLLSWTWQYITG